ncbi:MAG: Gldg family protein [Myxococcota bacterium]
MTATFTVARKELRALFQSPIAIIFLSVFLILTLFLFFTQARFFARGLADVRPLFQWLPLLLIFLVSAITMRSWAEERKAGTLEVLLTLPVRTADLVLGKFVAGMALVGLALLFTTPLPFMVWRLGPLDWGPVIGGYFAALLLASAYMAIGLCVSARTDNQVVALMVTLVLGGLLWLVGTDSVTAFFSADNAEILRNLGTGSRFVSVERGVLDLRDIVYYTSITALFLVLNGVFLEWERLDTRSPHGRTRSTALLTLVALVAANAVAANLWLSPIHRARLDLTAGKDYTISPTTKTVLGNLAEPVRIRAFLSENTHPLLAPLVPQIRDLLAEYQIAGGDKVKVEVADPNADETLEAELHDTYNIQSVPFGVADRHSQAVVNAYFHIAVVYGDKFEVLDFEDLVEVRMDNDGATVKLKNFEYDLTRAIKKVSQDFETIDSLIAKLPSNAQITAYITPATVPAEFTETADAMRKVGQDLAKIDPSKVTFSEIDPSTDAQLQQQLADTYGVQPLAADLFATQRFYLHMLITVGDHVERVMPRGDLKEPELRKALESSLRRSVPGQLKKVALATEEPPPPQPNPQMPPQMQPQQQPPDYRALEQMMVQNYEVERTQLVDGYVPEDVDVLVVGKMGQMAPKQQFAIDQFLMRGGSVVALAGSYRVKADRQGLQAAPEDRSLFQLLEKYGVKVDSQLVMSERNAPFPLPVQQRLGANGPTIQRIELIPYPFFPDLRGDSLNPNHPTLAGITAMTMPWSSPVSTTAETLENRTIDWLVKSGPEATLRADGKIEPEVGPNGPVWAPTGEPKEVTLGVAVSGRFPSYFAGLPNPLVDGASGADTTGRTLEASVADGRLIVLGSSELTSDLMISLAQNMQSEQHNGNIQLMQNLVDWTVEDTDLLEIRTAGAFARTLMPLEDGEASAIEVRTWLFVLFPVLVVVLVPRIRRNSTQAIPMSTIAEQS